MSIGHPVVDDLSLLAGTDQTGETQLVELVTRSRIRRPDHRRQVSDAQLTSSRSVWVRAAMWVCFSCVVGREVGTASHSGFAVWHAYYCVASGFR